jgi:xylulokinase
VTAAALGIDLGMSGARAAVKRGDARLIGRGRCAVAGRADDAPEIDPKNLLEAAIGAARAALADAGTATVDAIAVGALGPCPVLLDAAMEPVAPAPLFGLDARSEAHRRRLQREHGLGDEALGLDHVAPKLMWIRETEPQRFARAAWVVDAAGYIVAAFTGVPSIDRATAAYHLAPGVAPLVRLPEPREAEDIAGSLLPGIAQRLGLPAGSPVAVGGCDSYVDLAGIGMRAAGDLGILIGSTLVLGRVVETGKARDGLRCTPLHGPGTFLGGWTSACCSVIDWSERLYGAAAVAAAADLEPGAGGLLMLPYLEGERTPIWDNAARGAVIGASLQTGAAELHRAAIDAVALSGLDISDRVLQQTGRCESARVGGGGTRRDALVRALCDATGLIFEIAAYAGEAGAPAALALRALGHELTLPVERRLHPDPARQARYREMLERYRGLYAALAPSFAASSNESIVGVKQCRRA